MKGKEKRPLQGEEAGLAATAGVDSASGAAVVAAELSCNGNTGTLVYITYKYST
jgi:hypothetical protein